MTPAFDRVRIALGLAIHLHVAFYRRAVRYLAHQALSDSDYKESGIRTGVFAVPAASLSSSPDTQRMPVPYPPNLESAAAPATLAQVLIAEVGADLQSARGKPISSGDADDPAPARSRLGACIHRP